MLLAFPCRLFCTAPYWHLELLVRYDVLLYVPFDVCSGSWKQGVHGVGFIIDQLHVGRSGRGRVDGQGPQDHRLHRSSAFGDRAEELSCTGEISFLMYGGTQQCTVHCTGTNKVGSTA